MKSIKTKLLLSTFTLVLIMSVALFVVVNQQIQSKTEKLLLQQSQLTVEGLTDSTSNFLMQYEYGMQMLADSEQVKSYTKQVAEEAQATTIKAAETQAFAYFDTYLKNYEESDVVFIGFENKQLKSFPAMDVAADYDPTIRDWYKKALATPDEVVWSDPYIDAFSGGNVITIAKAVKANNTIIGVMGVDINLSNLTKHFEQYDYQFNSFNFLLDANRIPLAHPKLKEQKGEPQAETTAHVDQMYQNESGMTHFKEGNTERVAVFNTIPKLHWKIGVAFDLKEIKATANETQQILLWIFIIAQIVITAVLYGLITYILKPLKPLTNSMQAVADGDLQTKVAITTKDELGQLGENFNTMVAQMANTVALVRDTSQAVDESAQALNASTQETNAISEQMTQAISDISGSTMETANHTEDVLALITQLNDAITRVHQDSKNLTSIASHTEEMNIEGIAQANQLQQAFIDWQTTLQTMAQSIFALEDKVTAINTIIDAITAISEQTNLLALNASIEAARAGEHGKGFAVVAEEVRKLAEQSAASTEEVRKTVRELQSGSYQVAQEMETTSQTFTTQETVVTRTQEMFTTISEQMQALEHAVQHMHTAIEQVSQGQGQISESIQQVSSLSEETAAATEQVSASSGEQLQAVREVMNATERLANLSRELNHAITKFKL